MISNMEQLVRERAYELWTQSGCIEGRDEEHWFEAERQLLAAKAALTEKKIPATAARKVAKLRVRGAAKVQ